MEEAVAFITTRLGIDGASFNPVYLRRRIRTRMLALGFSDVREYLNAARIDRAEQDQLKDAITVNLTEFFRDPSTWKAIERRLLPELLPADGRRFPLRCWSAGCSSGEEAYSLGISLLERMRAGGKSDRVSILATDVDVDSLATARAGRYAQDQTKNLLRTLRDRYFERVEEDGTRSGPGPTGFPAADAGGAHRVKPALRDLVTFRSLDLAAGKPPGLFDLVLCRNVVIYFTPDMHDKLIGTVHAALKSDGYLVMGRTELLRRRHRDLFEVVDARERIYRKLK
jgi:two-component system CheB/CheR fusion protein